MQLGVVRQPGERQLLNTQGIQKVRQATQHNTRPSWDTPTKEKAVLGWDSNPRLTYSRRDAIPTEELLAASLHCPCSQTWAPECPIHFVFVCLCFTGVVCWVWVSFLSSLPSATTLYLCSVLYTCFHVCALYMLMVVRVYFATNVCYCTSCMMQVWSDIYSE